MFKGVHCYSFNSLYQIDKHTVITGGWNKLYIVNIDQYVIEKTKEDKTIKDGILFCLVKR